LALKNAQIKSGKRLSWKRPGRAKQVGTSKKSSVTFWKKGKGLGDIGWCHSLGPWQAVRNKIKTKRDLV